ncbi:hypothetical protein HMPREF2738_01978 [Clostridiales bacterium KLE1615]|nr:hypothetical protein HMPREF2738_01978 [Clostridiales bacterium KLE1615]
MPEASIKYRKINYLWIKYRFHSLPGNSGGRTAGTERKGCGESCREQSHAKYGIIFLKKFWI